MNGEPIEVTTYRTEGTYTDHRRPDEVRFVKSLQEDLRRRDFTMNALAMTKDGELIDLFGGQRIWRIELSVLSEMRRIVLTKMHSGCSELSVLRLSSVLISKKRHLKRFVIMREQIRYVSVERLKAEMDKLFTGTIQ